MVLLQMLRSRSRLGQPVRLSASEWLATEHPIPAKTIVASAQRLPLQTKRF
jgi:hypothetical protein